MDLKLDNGQIIALELVREKAGIAIISTIGNLKRTEIIFYPDSRKYIPDAGQFTEMR